MESSHFGKVINAYWDALFLHTAKPVSFSVAKQYSSLFVFFKFQLMFQLCNFIAILFLQCLKSVCKEQFSYILVNTQQSEKMSSEIE